MVRSSQGLVRLRMVAQTSSNSVPSNFQQLSERVRERFVVSLLKISNRILLVSMALTCQAVVALAQAEAEVSAVSADPAHSEATTGQPPADVPSAAPDIAEPQEAVTEFFRLPAEHHPWARFAPGAWREVEITTETFDEQGELVNRSVTTQQEILKSVSGDRYTLDVQATVDLVGKRIVGAWITRVLHLPTDRAGEIVETVPLDDASIHVGGREIECQTWKVVYRDDARTLIDRIRYTPGHFPFVLDRTTLPGNGADNSPQTAIQVVSAVALDIPYTIDDQVIRSSCVQTKRQGDKGSTNRIAFIAAEVPGGELVARTSDFDLQGTLTRWSTQELLRYGLTPLETLLDTSSDESPESRRQRRLLRRQNRR